MPQVKFVNEKQTIEVPEGANLRKEARKAGIELYSGIHRHPLGNCHGLGGCGKCAVEIVKGQENVRKPGLWERLRTLMGPILFLVKREKKDAIRLACQTRVEGDCEVQTHPDLNLHGEKFWG
ncbi:MAG TPA: 2Fe-2S iron-sulfur cluster-binding protein [Planctomycetaceae bacterium]|nr:2Fe-2S iron-sulfur cluster-binding protein [Planctomycetaceae bacterium]